MANTLTSLIPTMYAALDIVSRERVGFIPAVTRNADGKGMERAALNQSILVPIVPSTTAEADNTPAVTAPDTGDQTVGNTEITISKSKHIPVRWNGEETKGLGNAGTFDTIMRDRFAQAFRRLGNLIEVDLATSYKYASRGVGTPGTTPFGTAAVLSDFAGALKILEDNGAPSSELQLVLSNASMYNLRGVHSELFKVNEAGTEEMLRNGLVARLMGFDLHQSGQVAAVTKGTAASSTLTSTDYAVGSTSLTLASAGTGAFNEGDMVNVAGENNGIWYGVRTGDADVSNGGTLVLNNPGLTIAQTTNTSAVTVPSANWSANLAFHKNAIHLITRPPAMPKGGDMAEDAVMITDEVSGITFEVAEYKQFLQTVFHVRVAWGWKATKQEHIAVLFG
jgi:hypothetical protein